MDILLFGGGGHCKAVIDVIEAEGNWRIAGIVEAPGSTARDVLGYPVVGYDDNLADLLRLCPNALVTVGQIKSPSIRQRIFTRLSEASFALPSIVSPLARVARSARLDAGSIVMHYAQVGPDASIGVNTIINTRALVEHDAVVGDHCHIATTAVLNGQVVVGDGTLIGSGAICREGITIGANCLIAMGSRVRKPVSDGTFYFGDKSR
ncbi:Putative acetyltransferase EpsM [Paraburkholderia nemoris]|uniref:acetyltransferase n=1 Tax=Paraburkholderia nemoris TaxID=2793076 RepID=UPI001914130F|nr:acetyltransferase [Paraburkholderia nemoris]CAE6923177.1 Putative acetyltransferase EpsM [Paraburkholderia nemoris]